MAYFGKAKTDGMMMRVEPRTMFLVLWVALCVIVLTLILRNGVSTPQENINTSSAASVSGGMTSFVFVPRTSITAGQKLTADMFVQEERQVQGIQDRIVTNPSEFVGAYAASTIQEKSTLLKNNITYSIPSSTIASKIPEGFRAITVPVNAESGVEGWVRPGAHVDVVWLSQLRGKQVISTIVEDAEVLSAERSTDINDTQGNAALPSHITLLTSINDAQRIQLAKSSGTLSLNLRGSTDRDQHGGNTISTDSLLNKEGDTEKLDTVGWVQMGNKAYEVSATGKFNPTNEQKYEGPLFKSE